MLSYLLKNNTCQALRLAALLFVFIGFGCQKHSLPSPPTLTVLDAHGAPPDSGFCLLVRPGNFFTSTSPLSWDILGDSLHWDPLTGLVETPFLPPPGAQWLVASPSSAPPFEWRRAFVEVSGEDSCRLSETFSISCLLRSTFEVASNLPLYHVFASSETDLVHHVCSLQTSSGAARCDGWATTSSFPVELRLMKELSNVETMVGLREIHFEDIQTNVLCAWEDACENG